jgi:hypothetical protein
MTNIKITQLPETNTIDGNDLLLVVDSGNPYVTKNIKYQNLIKNSVKTVDGNVPSTIHNLQHDNADIIFVDLTNSTQIPQTGYLSLTGMEKGYNGQKITLCNISNSGVSVKFFQSGGFAVHKIMLFSVYYASGSLPENRFSYDFQNLPPFDIVTNSSASINAGSCIDCIYNTTLQKWIVHNAQLSSFGSTPGSVGGGGV